MGFYVFFAKMQKSRFSCPGGGLKILINCMQFACKRWSERKVVSLHLKRPRAWGPVTDSKCCAQTAARWSRALHARRDVCGNCSFTIEKGPKWRVRGPRGPLKLVKFRLAGQISKKHRFLYDFGTSFGGSWASKNRPKVVKNTKMTLPSWAQNRYTSKLRWKACSDLKKHPKMS